MRLHLQSNIYLSHFLSFSSVGRDKPSWGSALPVAWLAWGITLQTRRSQLQHGPSSMAHR